MNLLCLLLFFLPMTVGAIEVGIIGDSNSGPYFVQENQLYYNLAENSLRAAGYDITMYNSPAGTGESSAGALARLQTLLTEHPTIDVIVLSLGISDGGHFKNTHTVLDNFSKCIDYCREREIEVILATVDLSFYLWPYPIVYLQHFGEIYNILSKIYDIKSFPFICYHVLRYNSTDMVHGNDAAHKLWARMLENQLKPLLLPPRPQPQ